MTDDASVVFDFPSPKELRPPLIVLDDVVGRLCAGNAPVLSRLNLRIDPDDRMALVGRNGNGKTTLARLLAGQLKPMAGTASSPAASCGSAISPSIRSRSWLPDETPLQHMERLLPAAKPGEVRAQLGRFGFSGDKANLAVRQLSGGERARLSLALITRDAPHILILDEPTNHLDVDAREALVEALAEFGGAVVVVSHDRHLLGLIADRLRAGRWRHGEGVRRQPRRLSRHGARRGRESRRAMAGNRPLQADRKEARRLAAEAERARQGAAQDRNARPRPSSSSLLRSAETRSTPHYPRRGRMAVLPVGELMKSRAEVERQVAAAEERWLEASNDAEASLAEPGIRRGRAARLRH